MRLFLFTTLFLTSLIGISQTTLFKGTIMGFESENTMLSKNKHKNLNFQGGLKGVYISYDNGNVKKEISSNISGDFELYIPNTGNHRISFMKKGYSSVVLDIFQEGKPKNNQYEGLFILMKKTEDPSIFMGTIKILESGKLDYRQGAIETNKNSVDYQSFNFDLAAKAVLINNTNGLVKIQKRNPTAKTEIENESNTTEVINKDTIANKNDLILPKFKRIITNDGDVKSWKFAIDSARNVLLQLDSNSIEYKILLAQIEEAEEKIKTNELIIELKENKLKAANKALTFVTLFLVVIVLFVGLLLYFLKQRKTFITDLEYKNKLITNTNSKLLSSIRFASLIQNSYLQNPEEFKSFYPNSFIYNRPKDIVSGDFYWFTEINDTRIIIVSDCTGHGVPGAMLTVLGHSTLDTIIQDKTITKPSEIISALNKTILKTFGDNEDYVVHGMDMTVITSKKGSNEITLSGAANGIYTNDNNGVKYHEVSPYSLGQDMDTSNLTDTTIKLNKNDSVFMFTDGYVDQFKGNSETIEKFNLKRFESLLAKLSKEKDLSNSDKILDKTLNDWKGEKDQIDDILIVGFKI